MRKITTAIVVFILSICATLANPVTPDVAKTLAIHFYNQNLATPVEKVTLAYTEKDREGMAVYYAFNVNDNDGFVIISADDNVMPVIGYSNEGSYIVPDANTDMDYWMQKRKTEIIEAVKSGSKATPEIADYWNSYISNTIPQSVRRNSHRPRVGSSFPSNTYYLLKSTWGQSPYYNAYCPGGSVTGCVATAMAQIMYYWNYPSHGIDANCYQDLKSNGDSENYGQLCARYDTSNYVWSAMPANVTGANHEVAKLMYDCGVSVDMNYSPNVSTSSALGPYPSAEYSFPNYFRYSPKILHGIYESRFSDSAEWQDTLEHDLDRNRPIQYGGYPNTGIGHSWVCDGYDANNCFHMNWGWGGTDNGWYGISKLAPPSNSNYSLGGYALIGIMPPSGNLPVDCYSTTNSQLPPNYYYYYIYNNHYVTGCWGDTIRQIADYFANVPAAGYTINSVYIYFYKISSKTPGRTININIWDNTGKGGAPGSIIASKTVLVSGLSASSNMIAFSSNVTVTTPFYVGVDFTTLATQYGTDTIVVATDKSATGKATAWQYDVSAKHSLNGWYADSTLWGYKFSHQISVDICSYNPTGVNTINETGEDVMLYPNPTNGVFNVKMSLDNTTTVTTEVYNMLGQRVQEQQWNGISNSIYTIDLSKQPNGMYFVKISSDKISVTKKIMVNK